MSSYGGLIVADEINVNTIRWNKLIPPLAVEGTPSLFEVLTVSGDAQQESITDLNKLECLTIEATTKIETALVETTDIQISGKIESGATIEGRTTPSKTVCTNLDLTSGTNIFPTNVAEGIEDTLIQGNNANNQSLLGLNTLGANAIQAVQGSFTGSLSAVATTITGSATPNTGILNLNASTGGSMKLDFTGATLSPQDTFLEGDKRLLAGIPVRTKCTYLDLTDTTNLFTPSEQERYEWGGFWEDPRTTLNNGPQYKEQVFIGSYENNFPGWRYFRPMSDGKEQLPTAGDIDKFAYIPYAADANNPLLAFYVKTAPTNVAAHSSQIIQLSFPITRYGYGRIYLGLYYVPDATPSAAPVFIDQSFRLLTENIAQPGLADLRKGGHIMMEWIIKDVFPTDGTVWRVYPVVRTDDSEEYGALEIRIGDGAPYLSKIALPGPQNGQLFMYGRPWSQSFTEFSPQYGWPGAGI